MSDHRTRHVLALNDDAEILSLYRDLLSEEGHRVTTQQYPPRNLPAVAAAAPDVIVIDLMGGDGKGDWTMLQLLRMDPRTARTPIVLVTGPTAQVAEMEPRLRQLRVAVVPKPFDIEELLAAVRDALAGTSSGERDESGGADGGDR